MKIYQFRNLVILSDNGKYFLYARTASKAIANRMACALRATLTRGKTIPIGRAQQIQVVLCPAGQKIHEVLK